MKNNQYAFQSLLIIQTIGLLIYTAVAINNDGFNFIERAQEFVLSLTWMGQFALDFQCYLILSALWIAWRSKFTVTSILLSCIAMILGIIFFAPYIIFLIQRENGNIVRVLNGDRA